MCKWCARQCRLVRHHSSVWAQLRPRSPHVCRQNPDPWLRRTRHVCRALHRTPREGTRAHGRGRRLQRDRNASLRGGRHPRARVQMHRCSAGLTCVLSFVCLKTDCWQKASAAGSSCAGSSSAGSSAAGSSAGAPHRGLHSCVLASRHRAPRLAATTALCKLPVVACELPAPGGNIQRKKTPVSLFEATRGPPRERPVSYPRRAPEPNARFWKSTT